MQELKVIGVESGALVLGAEDGARFRVEVDEVLHARMRQATPDIGTGRKLSPKEIQAQIRAGLSAEDVAALTGADLDYVRRFEGPVIAEREYVVQSALAVPVRGAGELDPLTPKASFGDVIRGRLLDAEALGERWASWKEQGGGWIVKLTFTAGHVDRDARWAYDPKRNTLTPLNSEAEALSQAGDMPAPLIPRLRAVSHDDEAGDRERFDSGAFEVEPDDGPGDTMPMLEAVPVIRRDRADAAEPRRETGTVRGNQTADLLEALRRRRGERDPMDPEHEESRAEQPSTGTVRLVDVPLDTAAMDAPVPAAPTPSAGSAPVSDAGAGRPAGARGSRKGRAAMPSWDDIVFGARPDDD